MKTRRVLRSRDGIKQPSSLHKYPMTVSLCVIRTIFNGMLRRMSLVLIFVCVRTVSWEIYSSSAKREIISLSLSLSLPLTLSNPNQPTTTKQNNNNNNNPKQQVQTHHKTVSLPMKTRKTRTILSTQIPVHLIPVARKYF